MIDDMKTYKKWHGSGIGLNKYLGEAPCEIDEELYNYQRDILQPHYYEGDLVQGGDPIRSDKAGNIEFYTTTTIIDGKYYYLGVLPEFLSYEKLFQIAELKEDVKRLEDEVEYMNDMR